MTATANINIMTEKQQSDYARVLVEVGVALQTGQRLHINAGIENAPLVREVVRQAYRAGASLVDVMYADQELGLIRVQESQGRFDAFPGWRLATSQEIVDTNTAYLVILNDNPSLFDGQDQETVATYFRGLRLAGRPAREAAGNDRIQWCLAAYPGKHWAAAVFPNDNEDVAQQKLWDNIATVMRLATPDPVATWKNHLEDLERRREYLNKVRLESLHFRGPGTDLHLALPAKHIWGGGRAASSRGTIFAPNLPTEEVYTMPHATGVNGTARATKPLNYNGVMIENIEMEFKDGLVIRANASHNLETLERLLAEDAGAKRLGEVALVSKTSPVAKTGVVFIETLFDENAACHIALGAAYPTTIENGTNMTDAQLQAAGANTSRVHTDWMIGSPEIDVDGILPDGSRMALLRAGGWAFEP